MERTAVMAVGLDMAAATVLPSDFLTILSHLPESRAPETAEACSRYKKSNCVLHMTHAA